MAVCAVIEGYSARLSAAKLDFRFQAMVRVNLTNHGKENAENFARYLEKYPEVLAAYSVSGDADYTRRIINETISNVAFSASFFRRYWKLDFDTDFVQQSRD